MTETPRMADCRIFLVVASNNIIIFTEFVIYQMQVTTVFIAACWGVMQLSQRINKSGCLLTEGLCSHFFYISQWHNPLPTSLVCLYKYWQTFQTYVLSRQEAKCRLLLLLLHLFPLLCGVAVSCDTPPSRPVLRVLPRQFSLRQVVLNVIQP